MTRATIAEARVFENWQDYQDALKRAIAPQTYSPCTFGMTLTIRRERPLKLCRG
jgi:hypothetical protein